MNAEPINVTGTPIRAKGEVLLSVENISLRFGGVKAISDVSFDIRKGAIEGDVAVRDVAPHVALKKAS